MMTTVNTSTHENAPNPLLALLERAVGHAEDLLGHLNGVAAVAGGTEPFPESLASVVSKARSSLEHSLDDLRHPRFSVAFVGTTKAGKSTFVNAFVGRRLAPMEAEEMSAGVLRINQGDWGLTVKRGSARDPAALSEECIYDVLKESMAKVVADRHAEPRTQQVPQPIYEVSGPLFPFLPAHPFQRAVEGQVGLAVFDLPGLRTTQDPENHGVIREQISRAFSIVLIDRNSLFAREQRAVLLKELGDLVLDLGGDTSMMVFLLNKIDGHKENDGPIHEQVRRAKDEITEHLKPRGEIAVIPFSGLTYFHASRMYMAAVNDRNWPKVQRLRNGFVCDCAQHVENALKAAGKDFRAFRDLARRIQDNYTDGQDSTEEDLKAIIAAALQASGHYELWGLLRKRMAEHAPTVLILPHVWPALKDAREMSKHLTGYARTQLVETEKDINESLQRLEALQQKAADSLLFLRNQAEGRCKKLIELNRTSREKPQEEASEKLLGELGATKLRHPKLIEIGGVLNEVKSDLRLVVLKKMGEFLKANQSCFDVKGYFEKIEAASENAENISRAYEAFQRAGYNADAARDGIHRSINGPSPDQTQKANALQKTLGELFFALRRVMTKQAERTLRTYGRTLAAEVDDVSRSLALGIWHQVADDLIHGLDEDGDDRAQVIIREAIACARYSPLDLGVSEGLTVPEEVLTIPDPNLTTWGSRDKSDITYRNPNASCFKGEEIKWTKEDVLELNVPTADVIEETLVGGIDNARDALWSRFFTWFEECFSSALTALQKDFEHYLGVLREGLEKRRAELHAEAIDLRAYWHKLLGLVAEIDRDIALLERDAGKQVHVQVGGAAETGGG